MAEQAQNPGRKWRQVENDGDGNTYFDTFRFTPHTTDLEFFRDAAIYETGVPRSTQDQISDEELRDRDVPRGNFRSDQQIREEIVGLFRHEHLETHRMQVDVQKGIVTLSGEVNSLPEKQRAGRILENIFGILEIKNNLNITDQR